MHNCHMRAPHKPPHPDTLASMINRNPRINLHDCGKSLSPKQMDQIAQQPAIHRKHQR